MTQDRDRQTDQREVQPPQPAAGGQPPVAPPSAPWGLWATLGWTALIMLAVLFSGAVSALGMIACTALVKKQGPASDAIMGLATNGDLLSLSLALQVLFSAPVLFLAVKLRKGCPASDYLALKNAGRREYLFWIVMLCVYFALCESTLYLLKVPPSEWMRKIFISADYLSLLILTMTVIVPPMEELIFRGFLYKGLEQRAGAFAAIAASSCLWAITHIQYESYVYIVVILGVGVLLGVARWRTKTIYVPILLHVINNGVSSVQALLTWR